MESTYLNQVKKRLQSCCRESGLTLSGIHQNCKEEISYPSLRNLINGDSLPTNLSHVKTICDAVGADLNEVLWCDPTAAPEGDLSVLGQGNVNSANVNKRKVSGTDQQAAPASILKTEAETSGEETQNRTVCHCYLIADDASGNRLKHGILTLDKLPGRSAELAFDGTGDSYHGIRLSTAATMSGECGKDDTPNNTVYLIFQNSDGDALTLSFLYPRGIQKSCKGILVKTDPNSGAPEVQSMLLCEQELAGTWEAADGFSDNEAGSSANEALIKGALKMLQQYVYLPSDELEKMKAADRELEVFLDEYGFLLKDMGSMIRLKPDLMLSALDERDLVGRKKAIRAILKLANISINEDRFIFNEKQTIIE